MKGVQRRQARVASTHVEGVAALLSVLPVHESDDPVGIEHRRNQGLEPVHTSQSAARSVDTALANDRWLALSVSHAGTVGVASLVVLVVVVVAGQVKRRDTVGAAGQRADLSAARQGSRVDALDQAGNVLNEWQRDA